MEYYRLTPSDWPDFRAAVRDALSDGPLTVVELGDALTARRVYWHLKPAFDDGTGTLIKPLTWQGDMSLGPPRDGQHTFQRLDTNPRWRGIPDVEAHASLVALTGLTQCCVMTHLDFGSADSEHRFAKCS